MNSTSSFLDAASDVAAATTTPDWRALTLDATLATLGTTRLGLSSAEARRRQQTRVPSRKRIALPESVKRPVAEFAAAMFRELADPIHLVLFLVAVAGATLGAPAVAVAVVALTVARIALLAWIGWRCESITTQLRNARVPRVSVQRDGTPTLLDVTQLVTGDVIELKVGMRVPADLKLIEHEALTLDGAVLQGEASGVGDAVSPLLWSGAWITHGRATGVVVATGADAAVAMLSRLHTPIDEPLYRVVSSVASAGPMSPSLASSSIVSDASSLAVSDATTPNRATPEAPPSDGAMSDASAYEYEAPSPRPTLHLDRHNVVVLFIAAVVFIVGMARGTVWLHCLMTAVALAAVSWSANTRWFAPLKRVAAAIGARRLLASDMAVRDVNIVTRLAALPMSERESAVTAAPTITIAGQGDNGRARESADIVFNQEPDKLAEAMALAATTARGALGAGARATTVAQAAWAALLGTTMVLAALLTPSWPASVALALHVLGLSLGLALIYTQHPTTASTQPPRWLYGAIATAIGVAAVCASRLGILMAADTATLAFATFALTTVLFTLWAATERRNTWRTRLYALWRGSEAAVMAGAVFIAVIGLITALEHPLLRDAFETGTLNGASWGVVLGIAFAAVAGQFGGVMAWRKLQLGRPSGPQSATPSPISTSSDAPHTAPAGQEPTALPVAATQTPQNTSSTSPPGS